MGRISTLDYWEVQSNAALSRTYYRLLMKNFDPSKDPKTANFTNPDVEEEISRIGGGGGTTDQVWQPALLGEMSSLD